MLYIRSLSSFYTICLHIKHIEMLKASIITNEEQSNTSKPQLILIQNQYLSDFHT